MRTKFYFTMLSLSVLLAFYTALYAEPIQSVENVRGVRILLPASAPKKDQLTLLSFLTVTLEEEIVGAVALYDDPTTKRPSDYLELYNGAGSLLAASWFDSFGIQRTAMDRGLLEDSAGLEGVLVLIPEGTLA